MNPILVVPMSQPFPSETEQIQILDKNTLDVVPNEVTTRNVVSIPEEFVLKEQYARYDSGESFLIFDKNRKKRLILKKIFKNHIFWSNAEIFSGNMTKYIDFSKKNPIPGINSFDQFGATTEVYWLTREIASGKSLEELVVSGKKYGSNDIANLLITVCAVLEEYHSKGFFHANIKPTNFFIDGNTITLVDPDLGHFRDPKTGGADYQPQQLSGYDFLAPEQRTDQYEISPKTDIWGLTSLLAFALTGQRPPELSLDKVPAEARPVIEKGLAENPAERYQAIAIFREEMLKLSKMSRGLVFKTDMSVKTTATAPEQVYERKCPHCGNTLPQSSRTCPKCNGNLDEPCLNCQTLNLVDAKVCRECGSNLIASKLKLKEQLISQQQRIVKLRSVCDHDRAISYLKQMIHITHPEFAKFREWAKVNLPIFQKERRELRAYSESIIAKARYYMQGQQYEKIQQVLEQVPQVLVDEDMKKIYAEAGECIREVESLVLEIRNAISAKQYNTLLARVQRYAELKSNDPEAKTLQEKIEKLTTLTTSNGIKLRRIPSGKFYMGSHDSDEYMRNNEKPQHRVQITHSMYMAVTQVTQDQFLEVMKYNPSTSVENGLNPVDCVNWYGAIEFCNKLSEKEGLEPYYQLDDVRRRPNSQVIEEADVWIRNGNGYRLPTEAEWEYCSRAGSITPWCFGDLVLDVGQYAWYYDNSQLETHPVGMKKTNAWGLLDMHGNVMEWCYDWYNEFYYQQNPPEDDPTGPAEGSVRALRGGAWQFGAEATRSAYRNSANPDIMSNVIGFRIVRTASDDDALF